MGRNNLNWILTIILVLIILVILPQLFSFGRGHMGYADFRHPMHSGHGMMGYGFFGLWWIVPGIILVLIIALGVWVGNLLTTHRGHDYTYSKETCPHCSKVVAPDWKTCPYCSKKI